MMNSNNVQMVEQELLGLNTNVKDLKSIKKELLQIRADIHSTLQERHQIWQEHCKKYNLDPNSRSKKLGANASKEEKKDFEQLKKQFEKQNLTVSGKVAELKQRASAIVGLSDNQLNDVSNIAKEAAEEAKTRSATLTAKAEVEVLD